LPSDLVGLHNGTGEVKTIVLAFAVEAFSPNARRPENQAALRNALAAPRNTNGFLRFPDLISFARLANWLAFLVMRFSCLSLAVPGICWVILDTASPGARHKIRFHNDGYGH
jgi:hypothetical protein